MGYWLSNAKEQMTPIHWPWLSCYCTLMARGIVLFECFLLLRCASWPRIFRGRQGRLQTELVFWHLISSSTQALKFAVLLCHFVKCVYLFIFNLP